MGLQTRLPRSLQTRQKFVNTIALLWAVKQSTHLNLHFSLHQHLAVLWQPRLKRQLLKGKRQINLELCQYMHMCRLVHIYTHTCVNSCPSLPNVLFHGNKNQKTDINVFWHSTDLFLWFYERKTSNENKNHFAHIIQKTLKDTFTFNIY